MSVFLFNYGQNCGFFFKNIKIGHISLKLKKINKDIEKKIPSSTDIDTIWLGRGIRISASNRYCKLSKISSSPHQPNNNIITLHTKIAMIKFESNQKSSNKRSDLSLVKQLTASDFQIDDDDSAIQSESLDS